ncbi:hypothetical protein ACWERV_18560 [Streptomyces sp. NPDC004031]
MAETTDPQRNGAQHNHGPGVFIAGDVYGGVKNYQSGEDYREADESQASQEHQLHESEGPNGYRLDETEQTGPGEALIGWILLTASLLGGSGYCLAAALLTDRLSMGDRVSGVIAALGCAFGGVMTSAFVFVALAEVCATGTANATDSARKRWAQGQRTAARMNLRYAVKTARVAGFSAVLVGFITGLFGFLAVGKKAADRAYSARELAASHISKARSALRENPGRE